MMPIAEGLINKYVSTTVPAEGTTEYLFYMVILTYFSPYCAKCAISAFAWFSVCKKYSPNTGTRRGAKFL